MASLRNLVKYKKPEQDVKDSIKSMPVEKPNYL